MRCNNLSLLAVMLMGCLERVSGEADERGQAPRQHNSWDFCLISVFWDEIFGRCVVVLYPFKNSDINIWAHSFISEYSLQIFGGGREAVKISQKRKQLPILS